MYSKQAAHTVCNVQDVHLYIDTTLGAVRYGACVVNVHFNLSRDVTLIQTTQHMAHFGFAFSPFHF